MKRASNVALVVVVGCLSACGDGGSAASTHATTVPTAAPATMATMQATVDDLVAENPTLHGVVVHVIAPAKDVDESVASGDNVGGPLSPDATFRLASNTKTFTAAAVLRLVEQGKLDLDAPLTQCIDPGLITALDSDGYRTDLITPRQTLTHTAGLFDFAQEPGFLDAVFSDSTHHWTALEQVQWAVDHGAPLAAPGDGYAYSNTDYVLLGSMIECASGLSLADAYRQLLDFDALGLSATYLESREPFLPVRALAPTSSSATSTRSRSIRR